MRVTQPEGPVGVTSRGTELEAVRSGGCGLLHVRRLSDGEAFICSATAMPGRTPEDQRRIDEMVSS